MKDMHTKQMHTLMIHIETDLRGGGEEGESLGVEKEVGGEHGKENEVEEGEEKEGGEGGGCPGRPVLAPALGPERRHLK